MTHEYPRPNSAPPCLWGSRNCSRYLIDPALVGAIAAFFMLSENRPHLPGAVPSQLLVMFLILLAMVARHSVAKEAAMRSLFGAEFDVYAEATAPLAPRLGTVRHSRHPSLQSVEDHS